VVVELLEQATSLRVVSEFLKEKDVPHSAGSWKEMATVRLQHALDQHKTTTDELFEYLSEVEEYGGCHCFLFRCSESDAAALLSQGTVEETAKDAGLQAIMKTPAVTTYPDTPTVSGIRYQHGEGATLSVKVVETRVYEKLVNEKIRGDQRIYYYRRVRARAVNVMRLSSIGVLEVRIKSHTKSRITGASYLDDIARIWKGPLEKFFPRTKFEPLSLQDLQNRLWERRHELTDVLRFSDSKMKDAHGFTMMASTPKAESDLAASVGSVNAMEEFLASGARQVSENIQWKKQDTGIPSDDIHVLLSGERNEFTVSGSCTKAEYDYVLAQFTRIGI